MEGDHDNLFLLKRIAATTIIIHGPIAIRRRDQSR
jgi:hypothetical protein